MNTPQNSQPALASASINLLMTQADTVGRLAQDAGGFAAVFAAFESRDPDAFRWVLQRLELMPHCEVICEWVRIKLCVLRCVEICGPPAETEELPSLQEFASAVVKLASNEKLLRRVVDAVSCGDAEGYRAMLAELKLNAFCHLLCHWICSITYHRICEVVCSPEPVPILDPATEIRDAGKVISGLLANEKKALNVVSAAATALNCERLKTAIGEAAILQGPDGCETICRWICSWRCGWVCRELCRSATPIPLSGIYAVEEARSFALAARQLAGQPRALGDLVNAVQTRDAKAYGEIIDRFGLGPYCLQVCAWVCSVTCNEFCFWVCPAVGVALFTMIGDFGIVADIYGTTTGLTNKAKTSTLYPSGHGGPGYGFFDSLSLQGVCPAFFDPAQTQPMAYRFLFQPAGSSTPIPITGGYVATVTVSSQWASWNGSTVVQLVKIGPTASPPTPLTGPGLAPPDLIIAPDANGWVTVDTSVFGQIFSGPLIGFDTTATGAFPAGALAPGVSAGTAVPVVNQKNGTNTAIIFQATRVSNIAAVNGGSAPDYTNQIDVVHINNWGQVQLLNLYQFTLPGATSCSPISGEIDIQYTVDHELLLNWSISMTSASGISLNSSYNNHSPQLPVPSGSGSRGGAGTYEQTTTSWPSCSYIINLDSTRALTTGLLDDPTSQIQVPFCICG
jgi:hypothetical protein